LAEGIVEKIAEILYIFTVRSTYSVSEAQAQLPALLKKAQNDLIAIAKRDKTVAYLVSAERMEAIAETLEIMADPHAMQAIGRARRGQGKYYPVTILDEPGSR
jgi:PHD/YefM family antitoxin component YafN of YafNO toxin-antitoxin module